MNALGPTVGQLARRRKTPTEPPAYGLSADELARLYDVSIPLHEAVELGPSGEGPLVQGSEEDG